MNPETPGLNPPTVARAATVPHVFSSVAPKIGHVRWVICALLLFGTTKNYMDRQVLGLLKSTLQHDFGWNEIQYGNLVFAFQAAYAVGLLVVGRIIDRVGTRIGYACAMVFWSLASMGHAVGSSLASFTVARAALGFGEAGVFPASIKAVAEWFPRKERALATGIFNAGTNVGAMITPFIVPWIAVHMGWRWAFIITGALGFVWLILWLVFFQKPEDHPRVSKQELAYIFLIDPIWWFYLFWVPDFLQRKHGVALQQLAVPILTIYILADIGSVAGGWLSSSLIKGGATINAGRKITMLICALCVTPVVFAARVENLWSAVLLIGLAAAAHQGFSANLFTLTSDMFPSRAVGSVVGIGGMGGAIGGMLIAKLVGHVLQWTGSYMVPFLIAGSAYLVALGVIQVLTPRLEPAVITEARA